MNTFATLGSQLEKLTLFKPTAEKVTVFPSERPVTPINDEVLEPASSLIQLHNYLKRRLLIPRTRALTYLGVAEQEELSAVLFSEVTKIWADLQSCGTIALLNEAQNKEMLRRMTVYVITTCEIIFDRHIDLFKEMLKVGVYEKSANFTRIKRLLADEAARLLDVLTVRRYIGEDIRAIDNGQLELSAEPEKQSEGPTFAQMVAVSRPPLDLKPKWSLEADIQVLKSKFPNFDLSALRAVLSTLPALPPIRMDTPSKEEMPGKAEPSSLASKQALRHVTTHELLEVASIMNADRTATSAVAKRTFSATDIVKYYEPEFNIENAVDTFITQPVELDEEVKKAIVTKGDGKIQVINDPNITIQPLLKASLHLDGVVRRTVEKEQKIAELAKMIADLENKRHVEVRKSPYIQPDYFEVPVGKDVTLRASGLRVTERQLEAAMSLQYFTPLFDELTFDITESDVAEMDEALFVHKELADVYKEIVAVIPKDYLDVSSDKSVLPSATGNVDITRCMASARLQKNLGGGSAQISRLPPSTNFKPSLSEAPWSKEGFKTWVKTGPSKALSTTNRVKLSSPGPPGSAAIGRNISEKLPDYMDPKIFLSWHSGWRQMFNTEDFYKYINRQDTDFLGYIYHLWGEEGGRFDSAIGLSSGAATPLSVSTSPVRSTLSRKETSVLSSNHQSVGATPAPNTTPPGYWVVDPTIQEKLETEHEMTTRIAANAQMAKEGARIFSVLGLTQSITVADLGVQRIERRRKEEQDKRKLSPDEVLERQLAAMTIQQRFDRVWDLLRLDEGFRSQMAFKYSTSDTARLLHIIKLWEGTAHAILKREYALGQFEQFERIASDSNRYYEKGYLGSSQARFDEEVVRASLAKQLDDHEVKVKVAITRLANGTGGEVAMYRGRPYVEKMLGDRVQVLFWLAEERKAEAIRRHLADKKLNEALFKNSSFNSLSPTQLNFSPRLKHSLAKGSMSPITSLTAGDILREPIVRTHQP